MNQKNHSSDKGYKQTEVGVIPEDWEIKPLSSVVAYTNGKAHEGCISDLGKYIVVNSKFISTNGEVRKYSDYCFSPALNGEILMVMSDVPNGRAIARCFYVDRDNLYTVNQRICALRPFLINGRFLFYKLDRNPFYLSFDDGVKQTNLRKEDVLSCLLVLPPTKAEQTAIAAALSDADALIQSLEKLIAKKRNIKQGAMQKCLNYDSSDSYDDHDLKNQGNHKNHRNHSSDKWVVKKLGEIFSFSGGYTASREQLSDDGFCYLHYGDIHGANKTFINVQSDYSQIPKLQVPLKKISPKSLLNEGDIVFVDASEDDEGASRHIVVKNPDGVPYISGLHTIVAKSKDDSVNNDYKRYCFQSAYIKSQFKFYAVGTKVSGISKTNIAKIEIALPKIEDQTRIATILSDMDAEISALETKLAKYKQIKQGMMQELLTGRIRLV